MCYQTNITSLTTICYMVLCILIPVLYLITYCKIVKKKKHKKYGKAFIIAIIFFLILFSVKLIAKTNKCTDCYINNNCEVIESNKNNKEDKTTSTTSTTTTTTTTTTITTTTKVIDSSRSQKERYELVPLIPGEKKEIGKTSNGKTIYEINGVTYIDDIMIVNKTYHLPSTYYPLDSYKSSKGIESMCITCIDKTAYAAWLDMQSDAKKDGIYLRINSGYRPYSVQVWLYDSYVKRDGKEKADTYSARAGASEHQSGYCFDINKASSTFNDTKEAKWIHNNAYKYGYIIRFPDGKTNETGYKYESWHVRYVGTDLSYKLFNDGEYTSLEAYFGIKSEYTE